ncbi:M48 family metallopeptidase [Streptomyces sp. TS71-3]|uniref:M48 family metallopeptidase n=1 Tax=Streptomyces sp. TS71-3 TaxID=2733862 RepID=UPI001B04C654|nr:M48 family metalloprotease [Streptomyces sp. TS71-3]GHJ34788.1 hypothetical protein Sm713_03970 [Streptomyces sp. TS71-3]
MDEPVPATAGGPVASGPLDRPGAPAPPRRPPHLPSATLIAFILLIVAVLACTVLLTPNYFTALTGGLSSHLGDPVDSCVRRAIARIGGPEATMRLWGEGGHLPGVAECNRRNPSGPITQSFLTTTGLLATATALHYWFRSTSRARRRGVRPVTAEALPDLHTELGALAERAVPRVRVRFLIDLLDPAANGVAFGRAGRRYVLLGRGVLPLLDRDREAFEALVLHELAHLRNHDVDLTMITLGFLRVWSVLAFAPVALGRLIAVVIGLYPRVYGESFAQMLGLALLLVVARAQVLRTREYGADARVVEWQGRSAPLGRLLAAVDDTGRTRRTPAARGRAAGPLRRLALRLSITHPSGADRRAALADPRPLVTPAFGFALVLGACLVLVWQPSSSPVAHWAYGTIWGIWRPEPFTVLLVIVLGLAVLRATLYRGTSRLPALRWGLGLGAVVGYLLSPTLIADSLGMPASPGTVAGTALLLSGLLVLLVLWCEYLIAAWTPVIAAARHPLWIALLPGAGVAAAVLAAARPVFDMQPSFVLSQYDGSLMSHLPGLPHVFAVAEMIALDDYFSHIPWLLGTAALLYGLPALGHWCARRRAAAPAPRVPARKAGFPLRWLVAVSTYAALWWLVYQFTAALWGLSLDPLSDAVLLACIPAATGAAAAVTARHPVRRATLVAVPVALVLGALLHSSFAGLRPIVERSFFAFAVEGAFVAALAVSAVAALPRIIGNPGRRQRSR